MLPTCQIFGPLLKVRSPSEVSESKTNDCKELFTTAVSLTQAHSWCARCLLSCQPFCICSRLRQIFRYVYIWWLLLSESEVAKCFSMYLTGWSHSVTELSLHIGILKCVIVENKAVVLSTILTEIWKRNKAVQIGPHPFLPQQLLFLFQYLFFLLRMEPYWHRCIFGRINLVQIKPLFPVPG